MAHAESAGDADASVEAAVVASVVCSGVGDDEAAGPVSVVREAPCCGVSRRRRHWGFRRQGGWARPMVREVTGAGEVLCHRRAPCKDEQQ